MSTESMSCERSHALLTRYLDNELEEALAAPLRRHLLECNECRASAVESKNLRAWITPRPAPAVPEGFAARVARAAFEGAEPTVELRPTRPGGEILPFVLAATAIAAGVLFLLAIGIGLAQRPSGGTMEAMPFSEAQRLLEELDERDAASEVEAGWSAETDR